MKRLETLRARCALLGVVLTEIEDDQGRPLFVATRWSMTRAFASLGEVGQWLDHIGEGRDE